MNTFEFSVDVAVPPERVLEEYWKLERWPEVAPHVRAIDILHGDENTQVLVMTVSTRGRIDAFKTVRVRERNLIRYLQPAPPPILRHHHGSWLFDATETGTRVISRHTIDVNVMAAGEVLHALGQPCGDERAVRAGIEELIRNNSLQTMLALRHRLEKEVGHVEDVAMAG